jgi:hypothetical protein
MIQAISLWAILASPSVFIVNSRILTSNTDLICAHTEEVAVFDIFLDQKAQDTGWQLTCDGKLFWNTPVNFLTSADASTWKSERTCIATNATCYFDIFDASGDGLSNEGFYALTYGAVTVAVYEYGSTKPFLKDSFCFGPSCENLPLELAEEQKSSEGDNSNIPEKGENNTDKTEQSQNNKAVKIGGIIGGVVGMLILLVAIALVFKRHRNNCARGHVGFKLDEDSKSTSSGNDHDNDNASGSNQNDIRIVKAGTDDGDSI